jgi:hypothetical protein
MFVMLRAKAPPSVVEDAARVAIEHLEVLRMEPSTELAGRRAASTGWRCAGILLLRRRRRQSVGECPEAQVSRVVGECYSQASMRPFRLKTHKPPFQERF